MNTNVVEQYLAEHKVIGNRIITSEFSFYKEVADNSRIGVCKVWLLTNDSNLNVFIELPFRINRGESREVFRELCLINDELDENQCYELDVLSGTIRYRLLQIVCRSILQKAPENI